IDEKIQDEYYILGPGSTIKVIADLWKTEKTLLGVDVYKNRKLISSDVNEKQLLEIIKGRKVKLILSPIGGQGFILGRGNQQLSSKVIKIIRKENILVIATRNKISNLKSLHIDTGNEKLDSELRGYWRVITDYHEETVISAK
ncbi:MAG: ATP-NAD kinase family protein, partial [Candidatus Ranarchaeia archaeon]